LKIGFFKNERFLALFGDFLTKSDRKMSESCNFLRKIWAPSFSSQKEGSKSQGEFREFFEKKFAAYFVKREAYLVSRLATKTQRHKEGQRRKGRIRHGLTRFNGRGS